MFLSHVRDRVRSALSGQRGLFFVYGVYLVAAFALWRVRFIDMPSLVIMHHNPFSLGGEDAILHGSPLGPLMGYMLGIVDNWPVHIFYSVLVVAALTGIFFFVRKLANGDVYKSALMLALLSLTPLLHVLFSWIGKSDPLVVLAYIGFVVAPTAVLESAAVFFLVLAHREQALLILALHFFLFPTQLRALVRAGTGVVLALAWFYFYTLMLGGFEDRLVWLLQHSGKAMIDEPRLYLVPFLAYGWFIIPTVYIWSRAMAERWRLAAAVLSIIIFSTLLTTDHTRVAVVLSLPVYVYVLKRFAAEPIRIRPWHIALVAFVGLFQLEATGWGLLFGNW